MPSAPDLLLAGSPFEFTSVPQKRFRLDGWHPARQERFILALEAMGSVGAAARAVGMSRASAYTLRERPGAESFARAWDIAGSIGAQRGYDAMMETALDGITTVTIRRGGSVVVTGGHNFGLVRNALRDGPDANLSGQPGQ